MFSNTSRWYLESLKICQLQKIKILVVCSFCENSLHHFSMKNSSQPFKKKNYQYKLNYE